MLAEISNANHMHGDDTAPVVDDTALGLGASSLRITDTQLDDALPKQQAKTELSEICDLILWLEHNRPKTQEVVEVLRSLKLKRDKLETAALTKSFEEKRRAFVSPPPS